MKLNGYVSKKGKAPRNENTFDEIEKYIQRADILYGNTNNNEEITIIKINPSVYEDKTSSIKNLKQERKDKVKEIRGNQRDINHKQLSPKEGTDYINKENSNINNSSRFKQNINNSEIIIKATKREKSEKNYEKIANLFYPEMKSIKDIDSFTGGASDIKLSSNKNLIEKLLKISQNESDKNFLLALDFIYANEGGYANQKFDKGGATNFGITQSTYDDYCKRYGIKTKNVKYLNKEETIKIYYNDYWKKSGADKSNNLIEAIILFDTAVLHGANTAKLYYKKADGNLFKMIDLRRKHYNQKVKNDKTQIKYYKGWNNRADKLEILLNRAKEVGII